MIVVSDLIGTLTTGSPTRGLVDWVRHNQSVFRANMYIARIIPRYALASLGLSNMQSFGQWTMITALPLIKDATAEKIRQMAEWSVGRELWPKRRDDILNRLARHLQEGADIYVASSVFEPTVEAFAQRIGAKAIGTPLEIVHGVTRFATKIVASDRKSEEVLSKLGVDRVEVAYGDTWADIPLLECADRPVAVYPDDKLRRTALERGWEMIGDGSAGEARAG